MDRDVERRDGWRGRGSRLGRLGVAAGVASIAGCTGDSGGNGDPDSGGADDGADGTLDGTDDGDTGDESDLGDPEQRVIELRAILREFEGGYDQSVLDAADAVRRRYRDSVVFVNLRENSASHRVATGWFVTEDRVLTTKRKLVGLESVPVHTVDGEVHDASVVERHDGVENLALLDVDGSGTPIDRSRAVGEPPEPNRPLVQIGHHDEYGHWVATVGDYVRTQTFDASPEYIDEHVSNVPGLPGSGGAPVFDLDGGLVGMTNGSEPREPRGQAPPDPSNDYVYDWQMSHREWFDHLDAEQTFEEIDPWL